MSKVGEGIIRGLEQVIAFANGTADEGPYRVHTPAEIDVRAVRGRMGLTQQEFATRFGFSINTLPGAPGLDSETWERRFLDFELSELPATPGKGSICAPL